MNSTVSSSMMMRRLPSVVALLILGVGASLAAQQPTPSFVRWEPPALPLARAEASRADQQDTVLVPRRDYRYEGLAFGGMAVGAAGAWIGSNIGVTCPTVPGGHCKPDRLGNAVKAGLVGAALGGGLGYLVGRLSPKPSPGELPAPEPLRPSLIPDSTSVPDSTRRQVGYHHWKGAAIGSGAGALLGTLLVLGAARGCSDCNFSDGDILGTILVGAGLGGAFGFLVGLASPKYE